MTDSLSKPVAVSMIAHVTLVLLFLIKGYMAPTEAINLREAIRVDMVGLPEKQQELPQKAPAPAPKAPPPQEPVKVKEAPKPPKAPEQPKVDLHPKKDLAKSQKSALAEIKAMAALDKIKNEVSNKPAAAKPIKGNQVNVGNSLTGLDKIDFDRYFASIEEKIRANWSLPQWLIDAHLKAQALVLIDENGAIKKKQIMKSSGNAEFDDRMMDAIDRSGPFAAPPDRLKSVLSEQGIVFNFPQRGDG
jgi:colicin import membrane protein